MGKWTDKLYITHSEWTGEVGQHSASSGTMGRTRGEGFRRLPFDCCALSLRPFENPMCTADGIIFDFDNIFAYIQKHGTNPVTGKKLAFKDLFELHFSKNSDDEYHCPVSFKVFSDNTAIAAIKTTGNVYAFETIERLNLKAKHFRDLLNDEPFKKEDIVMLQDPHNLEKKDMSKFHYARHDLSHRDAAEEREKRKPINNINIKGMGGTASRIFAELQGKGNDKEKPESGESTDASSTISTSDEVSTKPDISSKPKKPNTPYNAAHFSTGAVAQSFTSTATHTVTVNEKALIDEDEFMYRHLKEKKEKTYASIVTNFGTLNVELYSDKVPRTCHNFVQLAKTGYYDGTKFHRNIRQFMIQGGDPTGTGKGGESIWKKNFPDEIKSSLSHDKRGVLSMANRGKNTNGSQFFITYQACTHLDKLHTIFGRVVGGLDVLKKLESVPNDEKERPLETIRMKKVEVVVDPFSKYKDRLERRLQKEATKDQDDALRERIRAKEDKMGWFGPRVEARQGHAKRGGVGKYLQQATSSSNDLPVAAPPPKKSKTSAQKTYGNFDNF